MYHCECKCSLFLEFRNMQFGNYYEMSSFKEELAESICAKKAPLRRNFLRYPFQVAEVDVRGTFMIFKLLLP